MLSSIIIEPWESSYMLYMIPGLIIWAIGLIWWIYRRTRRLPLLVQFFGSIEVAIGAVAGFIRGMTEANLTVIATEQFDPMALAGDRIYMAKVFFIGFITHWILLLLTLTMTVISYRKILNSQGKRD